MKRLLYTGAFLPQGLVSQPIYPPLPTGAFNRTASKDVQPVLFFLIITAPIRIFADIDLFNKLENLGKVTPESGFTGDNNTINHIPMSSLSVLIVTV